jgi:A/G-specific adenine glycosylase
MRITKKRIKEFQKTIGDFYREHSRQFMWRETRSPYKILVSEVMLQQTQTHRVIAKYEQFISVFPTVETLACAPFSRVLAVWQGLGYNRRAQYLHQSAQILIKNYHGTIPETAEELEKLPGIGYHTARSIMAFAFNKPVYFIETNIRTVFIHFFFKNRKKIHDKEIMALVEQTLPHTNPREWYFALMDYGAMLKKKYKNPNRRSAHYNKPASFKGSNRQVRGLILKALLSSPKTQNQLIETIGKRQEQIKNALEELVAEGFIHYYQGIFTLA